MLRLRSVIKKLINSYLTPRWLFRRVITDEDFEALFRSAGRPITVRHRLGLRVRKLLYFWPSIVDANTWLRGGKGQYRDPTHFTAMWPGVDDLFLQAIVERVSSVDAPVLDLGCSCGRHLDFLREAGLTNLTGIDVMSSALQLFETRNSEAHRHTTLHCDFFQRFLPTCPTNSFDLLYSSGATIELVHPSFDIVREMCRVASSHIVLAVYEDSHNYPRFYVREFARNGFQLIEGLRPISATTISLLVFQPEGRA